MSCCAGSAGDGQPPHENPRRLSINYKSSAGSATQPTQPKKGRTKATGQGTAALVRKLGPLRINFETNNFKTYKVVGLYSNNYSSGVGIWVRKLTSPGFDKWEDVPLEQRLLVRK